MAQATAARRRFDGGALFGKLGVVTPVPITAAASWACQGDPATKRVEFPHGGFRVGVSGVTTTFVLHALDILLKSLGVDLSVRLVVGLAVAALITLAAVYLNRRLRARRDRQATE